MTASAPQERTLEALKRWMIDAFKGRVPMRAVFWWGGVAWVIAFTISSGLTLGFTKGHLTGYWEGFDGGFVLTIALLIRAFYYLSWGVFIWWCISVWQCGDHEPNEFRRRSMRTAVAVLVIGNAAGVLLR